MISRRLPRRLLRHHLPIGVVALTSGYLLYATRSFPDVLTRLSFSSAYPALALLTATLLIGPLKSLAGERLAVSIDFRRDIGIWAGIVGLFHVVVGQCVHLRGRPWLYYIYENWQQTHALPIRHDLFGLANFTGLAAALLLFALLATSNDATLRKLGTPGWKNLQRWNYGCFGLTAIHTLTYQMGVETQTFGFVSIAVLCMLITVILQLAGLRSRRHPPRAVP
jgi:sulfoxide reductase heme-binding subunit YedZ